MLISRPLIYGRTWSKTKTKLMLHCEYPAVNSALSYVWCKAQDETTISLSIFPMQDHCNDNVSHAVMKS